MAGHAVHDLEAVADQVPTGLPLVIWHSATLPYLTESERADFIATLERIASRRRLHWIPFEGGLLEHTDWQAKARQDRLVARADMHGRWIEWLE